MKFVACPSTLPLDASPLHAEGSVDVSTAAVPEPWATRMVERGFTDPRYAVETPSMRGLGEATGLHASTISGIIHGRRKPGAETIAALVAALGEDVQEWLGATVELGPYQPPAESALLTASQRDALTTLIRSIAAEQRKDGGGHAAGSATPMNQAGNPPATQDDVDLAAYAKAGPTRLQQLRAAQDAAGEHPDPSGSDETERAGE